MSIAYSGGAIFSCHRAPYSVGPILYFEAPRKFALRLDAKRFRRDAHRGVKRNGSTASARKWRSRWKSRAIWWRAASSMARHRRMKRKNAERLLRVRMAAKMAQKTRIGREKARKRPKHHTALRPIRISLRTHIGTRYRLESDDP